MTYIEGQILTYGLRFAYAVDLTLSEVALT